MCLVNQITENAKNTSEDRGYCDYDLKSSMQFNIINFSYKRIFCVQKLHIKV